jgi:hypothetical protein
MRLIAGSTFALITLLAFQTASGQAGSLNVVTSAVPFLRISPDARAGGMGDLGIATAPDANTMFWNLAKTPFNTSKGGLSVTYTPWLKDIGVGDVFLASLSGFYKIDEQSAFSGGFRFFNLGDIQFTNFSGDPLSTGKPTELGIDLGYSRKLNNNWGIGAALRYINSNLARGLPANSGVDYRAGNTVAGDVSIFYNGVDEIGQGLRFGVALSNLGGKIGYTNNTTERDYIPANMGIGLSYTAAFDEQAKLMVGLDFNKLMVPTPPRITGDDAVDEQALFNYRNKGVVSSWFSSFGDAPGGFREEMQEVTISAGAEFVYQDQFFVRAGYFFENPNKGNRKFATAGFGIKYNTFKLDFSYLVPSGSGTNRNPLSNTLRFALTFDLDAGN